MIDKFGNVFYLIIFLAHFIIGIGSYAYQLVFDTKKFLKRVEELIKLLL